MKLTSELLSGVYEKSAELQRLDAVVAHNEVREDLEMLGAQIKGCMHLLDELSLARESLETAGYSTEWFDIINKDNNFMAVVDLDMPKFFGGDEAKQAACESAIIETIKKWVKAVWEWIKSFFAKIKAALYWVKGLWVHNGRAQSETLAAYQKVVGLMKNSDDAKIVATYKACYEDVTTYDPEKIFSFLAGYRGLMECCVELNKDLDPHEPKNKQGLGPSSPMGKVLTAWDEHHGNFGRILSDVYWRNSNVPPRGKIPLGKDQGFDFDDASGFIKFAPIIGEEGCAIPKFEVGYSQFDEPKRVYWGKRMREAAAATYDLAISIANAVNQVEKSKRAMENLKNTILQENNMAPDDPIIKRFEVPFKLYVNICTCLQYISTRCIKLSSQIDIVVRKFRRNVDEVLRDLESKQQ